MRRIRGGSGFLSSCLQISSRRCVYASAASRATDPATLHARHDADVHVWGTVLACSAAAYCALTLLVLCTFEDKATRSALDETQMQGPGENSEASKAPRGCVRA
ncbi:hypothetical protein MTO96_000066 [Rhipicephalus appendiculatus]